jgi:hypothetical protein
MAHRWRRLPPVWLLAFRLGCAGVGLAGPDGWVAGSEMPPARIGLAAALRADEQRPDLLTTVPEPEPEKGR